MPPTPKYRKMQTYCREREILAREIALSTERGVHIVVKKNELLFVLYSRQGFDYRKC